MNFKKCLDAVEIYNKPILLSTTPKLALQIG